MTQPLYNVLDEIRNTESLYTKCQLYEILLKREGINYEFNGKTGNGFCNYFILGNYFFSKF